MAALRSLFAFALFAALLQACQYPVDSSTLPETQEFLVIESELTENYGRVSVFYTLTEVTSNGGYLFPPPPQASAYVLDSQGNRHDFNTQGARDTTFKGIVGETYRLFVEVEGRRYESQPETMRACPPLDSLTAIYVRENFRDPDDLYYDGFDVYATLQDDPAQDNYYQWDWIHYVRALSCAIVPIDGTDYRVPCTPYDCWSITYNTRTIVQSDQLRNGQSIAHRIVRIPYATPPNKYYLRVEQRSVTPSVYGYLKSLETQTQNVGSLFDIPAQTRFSPNIANVDDPSEKVLGVFSVFSYRNRVIFINMLQQIPGAEAKNIADTRLFIPDPLAQAPCTETLYRTQVRPEGWED
jgi:hypothetical protein